MHEVEILYKSACEVVQRDFRSSDGELHPHFTVIIGAERDEVKVVVARTKQTEAWSRSA